MEINTSKSTHNILVSRFFHKYQTLGHVLEQSIYRQADALSDEYTGGHWYIQKHPEANAFWFCLDSDKEFTVHAPNGNEVVADNIVFSAAVNMFIYNGLIWKLYEQENKAQALVSDDYYRLRDLFYDNLSERDASKLFKIVD
ncbi:hypothetical protein [Endozoicomonas sp. ALB115]|uniref:hypothetical protein n=1 Tax=Endozoicomonas sp. ALB115 TaxID=3403074 RepID=UPI003BB7BAB5